MGDEQFGHAAAAATGAARCPSRGYRPGGKVGRSAAHEAGARPDPAGGREAEDGDYLDAADITSIPSVRVDRRARRGRPAGIAIVSLRSGKGARRGRTRRGGHAPARAETWRSIAPRSRRSSRTRAQDGSRGGDARAAGAIRMGDGWRAVRGRSTVGSRGPPAPAGRAWEEPGPRDLDWLIPFAYGNVAMVASRAGRLAGAIASCCGRAALSRSSALLRLAATGDLRALLAVRFSPKAQTRSPARAHRRGRSGSKDPDRPAAGTGCGSAGRAAGRRRWRRRCRRRAPGCRTRRRLRPRPGAPGWSCRRPAARLRRGCGRR